MASACGLIEWCIGALAQFVFLTYWVKLDFK
jgi:hypothetical protein